MAAPNHLKFDLENGDGQRQPSHGDFAGGDEIQGNDEYANLVRFISTYRDDRRKSTISLGSRAEDADEKKVPAWKFWAKKKSGAEAEFVAPEEWMQTDMHAGLTTAEVEQRRKRAGFNELTTEKTNLFIQFLSYFQGPILYGKALALPPSLARNGTLTLIHSHGNRCPSRCWSS